MVADDVEARLYAERQWGRSGAKSFATLGRAWG
jgi:hypothetical protein